MASPKPLNVACVVEYKPSEQQQVCTTLMPDQKEKSISRKSGGKQSHFFR